MPNELLIRVVLHGGILPGFVATLVLGALWWRHTKRSKADQPDANATGDAEPRRGPVWALPVLMALGVIAADYVVKQSADLWPDDNTKRVLHAIALIGLLAAAESLARLPFLLRLITRAAAFAGATWMLTEGYRPGVLSDAQLWVLVAGSAVAAAAIASLAERGLSRTTGWTGPLAALSVLGAAQPFLFFAGFATGSIALVGSLAVLSAALLVSLVFKRFTLAGGTATVLVGIVLIGLLGAGIQTEPKSIPALIAVALAPAALAITLAKPIPTLAVRAGIAGLLVGAGLGLVHLPSGDEPAEDDPYADYYAD